MSTVSVTVKPKKLFIDRAFGSKKICPSQFNDVTDKVTGKCGGLPLAIICTARLVANQPETEQEQLLDYVNNSLPSNLRTKSSSTEILTQVLNLCYSRLPCSLRTCLLYLSMYPENYLFLKEDLVKQWMAEDFICALDGNDIADVAGGYFDELVSLGMIQRMDMINSNKKGLLSYTVHPVVFDFVRCKSTEDNFVTTIDYSQSTAVVLTEKVRRLSLHFGSATYATTPACVEVSQVRSLSFMGLLGCMPSIAEFMLVRVVILHIHSDDGDTKFSLEEICKLLQLRYLQVQCNVTVVLPHQMRSLKHLETVEINAGVEYVPPDMFHASRLLHVRLVGTMTSQTRTFPSVDDWWSVVPSPPVFLQSFELLPPICIFSRIPLWFRELRKLRILEIVVRKLWNSIYALDELPVLRHLSLYVRTPTKAIINFRKGVFPALEYFKFVCGVLVLAFQEETLPKLRKLKLVFNAHKGEQYKRNMILVGIRHLSSLEEVVGSIGLAPDAVESDRIVAESAFKDAIRKHPRHGSFEQVEKIDDPVDEGDPVWTLKMKTGKEKGAFLRKLKPPSLGDSVWVLENITKEGPFHNNLELSNIKTVKEFLRMLMVDPDQLRAILGDGMTDGMWEETTKHARTCYPGNKVYAYSSAGGTIYTNSIFNLVKVEIGGIECPLHQLNSDQTMLVRQLSLEAYEHPGKLMELQKRSPPSLCRYPPSLGDSVWVLENITKEGTFHNNLEHSNIKTVQEFLRMLMVHPDQLRAILGDGMTDGMWEETTKHARTCYPGAKVYVYTAGDCTIYVNSVFNLVKVEIGGTVCPLQQLNWDQVSLVLLLIIEAYEHRHELQETNEVVFVDNATDNIALLRTRFKEQARADTQPFFNNMVPNPWVIQ